MTVERHRSASQRRRRRPSAALRFFVIIFAVASLAVVSLLVFLRLAATAAGGAAAPLGPGAADLGPLERAALAAYLTARSRDLAKPAGDDPRPATFTVLPGESAADVAARLKKQGFVRDDGLFRMYMRYQGLDATIEAGDFTLTMTMTVPEIAAALGDAAARETTLTIPEGWRLEQIAEYLEARTDVPFGRDQFLAVTRPATRVPGAYSFFGDLPPGASFEGFLFPDTYRLGKEATATDLVSKMLANFEAKVAPLRADMARRGLTVFQAATLAAIVEREAVVDDERPLIAGVYLNRQALGMKLDADPTVQYAVGYQADIQDWWKHALTLDDLAFDSHYNTYLYAGLPPGPIASPGLASIQAVVYPAETDYLYFRAACDGSGRHVFARTLEEQVANACE